MRWTLVVAVLLLCEPAPAFAACATLFLLDLDGDGLYLTDLQYAVRIDLDGDGRAERWSWTAPGAADGFLWLDADGDRRLDLPGELLGCDPRGEGEGDPLAALPRLDAAGAGGDGDGWLAGGDDAFSRLGLWLDRDHDGRPAARELTGVRGAGVVAIGTRPRAESFLDGHLNLHRASFAVGWRPGHPRGGRLVAVGLRRAPD